MCHFDRKTTEGELERRNLDALHHLAEISPFRPYSALLRAGFGPPVEMTTPEGLDREWTYKPELHPLKGWKRASELTRVCGLCIVFDGYCFGESGMGVYAAENGF